MSSTEADTSTDKTFEIHDDLLGAGKYAATLALLSWRPERGAIAFPDEPTGTVTFLEIEGKAYALTADHVCDGLKNYALQMGRPHQEGYFVPVGTGMLILGPFIVPPKDAAAAKAPDIAMCPVDRNLLASIGKEPFVVHADNGLPSLITFGYSVGFPTGRKMDKHGPNGTQLAMQCVHVLAEFRCDSVDQIRFLSQIQNSLLPGTRLSGMSGGPVFWSEGDQYGIAGFVIEAIDSDPEISIYGDKVVQFIAQRADYETLVNWASYVDSKWEIERDKLTHDRSTVAVGGGSSCSALALGADADAG